MSLLLPLSNQFHSKPMAISSITSPTDASNYLSPSSSSSQSEIQYDYYYEKQGISLEERRQRNKTASAKYRAKKNQQHGEMRTMIASLTKENELLIRQLETLTLENKRLKTTCDKLRGKMMAQKLLKQFVEEKRTQ